MQIMLDVSEIRCKIKELVFLVDSLESIPKHIRSNLFILSKGMGFEVFILSTGTARDTGNHVIRLGVRGVIEDCIVALRALKGDFIFGHEVSPC